MQIITLGLDLAKRIFQVHAVDASGEVVIRKALRRSQVLAFSLGCVDKRDSQIAA
jgi:transposase